MDTLNVALKTCEEEVAPILAEAESVAAGVVDEAGYQAAVEYLKKNALAIHLVKRLLDPFVNSSYDTWKKMVAMRSFWLDPLKQKREIVEPKAAAWLEAAEAKRQEQQKRLEAEEAKRREESLLAQAEAAERAGDSVTAEAILNQSMVATPIVLPRPERVAGVAHVERWKAEVTDFRALVVAAVQRPDLMACLRPDQSVLDAMARAQKGVMNIPGVRVVKVAGLRIGSRAAS